jgi:hypothetical protein
MQIRHDTLRRPAAEFDARRAAPRIPVVGESAARADYALVESLSRR